MIFRITVNDNDFTSDLEKFASNLFVRLYWTKNKTDDMSYSDWYEKCYKVQAEIQKLMNPNLTLSLTEDDKPLLRAAVFLEWRDYVDSHFKDAETKEYLKKNFVSSVSEHLAIIKGCLPNKYA